MIFCRQILSLQGETGGFAPNSWESLRLLGGRPGRGYWARPGLIRNAFTFIELLLVLAILAVAVAIAAPSLSRFFQGRALDSEARRMLALTRYARSRAVSEGMPMVVWFKPEKHAYGLQAETTFAETDPRAVEYELDSHLDFELAPNTPNQPLPWKITTQISGILPSIRFTPDGFVSETSPAWVWLKISGKDLSDAVWLALNENRLIYELQTIQPR